MFSSNRVKEQEQILSLKTKIIEKLKTKIIEKLKTFSEIKEQYHSHENDVYIYRSAKAKYFSKKASKYGIEGCPLDRPTSRLSTCDYKNTKNDIDPMEPVWYTPYLGVAELYCNGPTGKKEKYETYRYRPNDHSKTTGAKLVFLDLTGDYVGTIENGIQVYNLDKELIQPIYDYIFHKYSKKIETSLNKYNQPYQHMCIDDDCKNDIEINEIQNTYGYHDGKRITSGEIDRFFTLELFHIIKDLGIENGCNCKVLGYYHSNVTDNDKSGIDYDYDEDYDDYDDYYADIKLSAFPAEFAIRYGFAICNSFIDFDGKIDNSDNENKNNKNKRKRKQGSFNEEPASKKYTAGNKIKKNKSRNNKNNKNKTRKHNKSSHTRYKNKHIFSFLKKRKNVN
jgi:hypothetical protein